MSSDSLRPVPDMSLLSVVDNGGQNARTSAPKCSAGRLAPHLPEADDGTAHERRLRCTADRSRPIERLQAMRSGAGPRYSGEEVEAPQQMQTFRIAVIPGD